jgi:RecA/RadA recombinase
VIGPDDLTIAVAFTAENAALIADALNRWRLPPGCEVDEPAVDMVAAWNRAIKQAMERGAHPLSPAISDMRHARDAMAGVILTAQAYRRAYGDGGRDHQREAARGFDVAFAKLAALS